MIAEVDTFFEKMPSNPWIFLGLAFLTALSIILAFVFYIKSIKNRAPCFSIRHTNIIHEGIRATFPALEIHYRGVGEEIKNFTVTKVRIWNRGKEPIRKSDVVKAEPFTISVATGSIIYDAAIIQEKHASNNFTLSKNQAHNNVILTFDHMAWEEGVVIQILHSGKPKDGFEVTGKLVDGRAVQKRPYATPLMSGRSNRKLLPSLFPIVAGMAASVGGLALSILGFFIPAPEQPSDPVIIQQTHFWTFTGGTIFFGSIFVFLFWMWYRARPSKGFEAFDTMP